MFHATGQVFWGANLVLLLLAVYYLLPFAHNTSPARWQTRVADLWERTVLNAPEVICRCGSLFPSVKHQFGYQFQPESFKPSVTRASLS